MTQTPRRPLVDFLCGAFSPGELSLLVDDLPHKAAIRRGLPGENVPHEQRVASLVALLQRRGELNRAFFQAVLGRRPGKFTDVARLARLHDAVLPDLPETAPLEGEAAREAERTWALELGEVARTLPQLFHHSAPDAQNSLVALTHRVYVRVCVAGGHWTARAGRDGEEGCTLRSVLQGAHEAQDPAAAALLRGKRPGASSQPLFRLSGPPGAGKSTLLKMTTLDLLQDKDEDRLVVLLTVDALVRGGSLAAAAATLPEVLGEDADAALGATVSQAAWDGRALLLIDGMDEVDDEDAALAALRRLRRDAPGCTILVSGRPEAFERSTALWEAYTPLRLLPLPRTESLNLLRKRFHGDEALAERVLDHLEQRGLDDFRGNPLLLTLVALITQGEGGDVSRLPTHKVALYRRAIDFLTGDHPERGRQVAAPGKALSHPALARRVLSHAALELHGESGDRLRSHDLHAALRHAGISSDQADALLAELQTVTGLLSVSTGGLDTAWVRFQHRTLREHLAASCLYRLVVGGTVGKLGSGASSATPNPAHSPEPEGASRPPAPSACATELAPRMPWWKRLLVWLGLLRPAAGGTAAPPLEHPLPAPRQPKVAPSPPTEESLNHPVVESALSRAADNPAQWGEVFAQLCALLAGHGGLADAAQTQQVEALVDRIITTSERLAFRVVAAADTLPGPLVVRALQMDPSRDAWEQRAKLFQRLWKRELVTDPVALVLVMDRYRAAARPRHGVDLFWLGFILKELAAAEPPPGAMDEEGERHGRARTLAQNALGQLHDHIPWENLWEAQAWLAEQWRPCPPDEPGALPHTFNMGSTKESDPDRHGDEGPAHAVTVEERFWMSWVPVTNAIYELMDDGHRDERPFEGRAGDTAEHPVSNVTWWEAAAFARWVGTRLPTEVEWECACRAGTQTRFWSGPDDADLFAVGWVGENSGGTTHPVATPPTDRGHQHPWGLTDLHGNVWEWCSSEWSNYVADPIPYRPPPAAAQPGDPSARRVIRGSVFDNDPVGARSAFRNDFDPGNRSRNLGFRLVLPGPPRSRRLG